MSSAFLEVPLPSNVAANEVEDTKDIYDADEEVNARAVPGYDSERYIPFGDDNELPYKLESLLGMDDVTSQNMLFNLLTTYGGGVEFTDKKTKLPTDNEEIEDWIFAQSIPCYFAEQSLDMKVLFFTVSVIILNNEGTKINKIRHKDASDCRFQKANDKGVIEHIYYGDWKNNPDKVERIPLLDECDPLGDLRARLKMQPKDDGSFVREPTKDRKFAILRRFPSLRRGYYPVPFYTSIYRSGSYREKRLISIGKISNLEHTPSPKIQVEVERGYWDRICDEAGIRDMSERKKRIADEKKAICDFIAGVENSGKAWITTYYMNPDGHEVRDVRIVNLERAKEGGDWKDDLAASANSLCYAFNVHPNLVGASPGKSQTNNSGSDKRELFTMKQFLETLPHHIMMLPLETVCRFNNWPVKPTIPILMLSTLDEHTDGKKINVDNDNENGNGD